MKVKNIPVYLIVSFSILILSSSSVFAQSSDYEKAQSFVKEAEIAKPTEAIPEEDKLIGHVTAIEIGGKPSTDRKVILNQITFKVGDTIHMKDINLSYKRLYQLDLFWYVQIKYKPVGEIENPEKTTETDTEQPEKQPEIKTGEVDEVGDIVVYVDVWQGFSYYLFPFESGAIAGDKDFFLTGKTVEAAYFQSGKEFRYWHLNYVDPQFLGSHNIATIMISHLEDYYGIRDEDSFDLGERYDIDRNDLKFNLRTRYHEDYWVDMGFEYQDNSTGYRAGTVFADTSKFYLSGEEFTAGNALILSTDISRARIKGYPWVKEGYSVSAGTDQALAGLGSDETFGRYKIRGTLYVPVPSLIDTIALRAEYNTTSGNPPHYQKPRLGYAMRGHTSLDYFGDSTILLSGELRKTIFDDRFQLVYFVDCGKGFDSRQISFKDLDVSSGFGIRVNTAKFVRYSYILRADYAWGPTGDRWTLGLGQWF